MHDTSAPEIAETKSVLAEAPGAAAALRHATWQSAQPIWTRGPDLTGRCYSASHALRRQQNPTESDQAVELSDASLRMRRRQPTGRRLVYAAEALRQSWYATEAEGWKIQLVREAARRPWADVQEHDGRSTTARQKRTFGWICMDDNSRNARRPCSASAARDCSQPRLDSTTWTTQHQTRCLGSVKATTAGRQTVGNGGLFRCMSRRWAQALALEVMH